MAASSITPISQSQPLFKRPDFGFHGKVQLQFLGKPTWEIPQRSKLYSRNLTMVVVAASAGAAAAAAAAAADKSKKRYPGEAKGFVEEMRFVAMKLHTRDQAKEGEKESQEKPVAKWEPSIEGYVKFLVDSKHVYDTLESIVKKAPFPECTYRRGVSLESNSLSLGVEVLFVCGSPSPDSNDSFCCRWDILDAEFRDTGLERSESLAKDLDWFREQGHTIPEPSSPGVSYAQYLQDLSEKDPQAFLCHFYNIYFAHSAGGRMIGRKVAEMVLDKKELEFYKWDGDLSQLLQNAKDKINKVAESWSREEKNHCLEETEKSFKFSGDILRLILS